MQKSPALQSSVGQFQGAADKYSECLAIKPNECVIYTNRALCYLKLEGFAEAKQDCDSALQIEPNNKKAFYRRALAHKGLKDYLSASTDLQEVLQLDPNVQEAEQELETVTNLLRESLLANSQGVINALQRRWQTEVWLIGKLRDKELQERRAPACSYPPSREPLSPGMGQSFSFPPSIPPSLSLPVPL